MYATSSGTITNVYWDFGDGSTNNTAASTVSHLYPVAGTNTVILSISGPLGSSTLARTNYIVVTNPPPVIVLSTNLIIVPEGSSNSFTVMLSRPPDNDVAVATSFTSGGTNLSVIGGGVLAFNSNNWNIAQPVFIGAVTDLDTVNEQAQFTLSSPGLLSQTITAIEADKDFGLIVSTNALTVPEGSTNSFTVQLNNQPGSEVTVSVAFASGDTNLGVADGPTLIFNPTNWNLPQSVAISAADRPASARVKSNTCSARRPDVEKRAACAGHIFEASESDVRNA